MHVGGGGGFHVSGGGGYHASVHWGGGYGGYHSWGGVRGSVYVGGYRPYYRPYYNYYYPVPAYYGASYYPVEAAYATPAQTVAVVAEPELPKFGIGAYVGGVSTDYNQATNTQESDYGLIGRYRLTTGLIIEGELGKTSTNVNGVDNVRVDRRLGGSLIYEIGAYNRFAPYVLVGLGVNQANVDGDYNTTQDYGEIGAGLRFAINRNFHIAADIRAGQRSSVSNDSPTTVTGAAASVAPPTSDSQSTSEDYTRARLSAILYF